MSFSPYPDPPSEPPYRPDPLGRDEESEDPENQPPPDEPDYDYDDDADHAAREEVRRAHRRALAEKIWLAIRNVEGVCLSETVLFRDAIERILEEQDAKS